jgi:hypothetical protein
MLTIPDPKSLSGQRLLHRSTFHLGHMPTSMTLLPSTLSPFTEQNPDEDMADNDSEPSKTSTLNRNLSSSISPANNAIQHPRTFGWSQPASLPCG